MPTTHRERREYLENLEEVDPIMREKGLTDRFMARDHVLHERCFYEGYCSIDELRREFEKVKRYNDDIEKLDLADIMYTLTNSETCLSLYLH